MIETLTRLFYLKLENKTFDYWHYGLDFKILSSFFMALHHNETEIIIEMDDSIFSIDYRVCSSIYRSFAEILKIIRLREMIDN